MGDDVTIDEIFNLIENENAAHNHDIYQDFPEFCFSDEDYMACVDAEDCMHHDPLVKSTITERRKTEMSRLIRFGWKRNERKTPLGKKKRYVYTSPDGNETSLKGVMNAINFSIMIDNSDISLIEDITKEPRVQNVGDEV